MTSLQERVNQDIGHRSPAITFNLICKRVQRTGQDKLSVVVFPLTLKLLPVLTLFTAANSERMEVALPNIPLVLVACMSGQGSQSLLVTGTHSE